VTGDAPKRGRGWPWVVGGAALLIALGAALAWFEGRSQWLPAYRVGPPALVATGGNATLWLLTQREERRSSLLDLGSWSVFHFELHGHDARTAQRLWTRRLLSLPDDAGGRNAQARILGPDGDVVWLLLNGQPVALASADGSVRAIAQAIVERNPGLAATWPSGARSFTHLQGLVVITGDALRWHIDPGTFAARALGAVDEEAFSRALFRSTQWNGGWLTGDFTTRHLRAPDGSWIGLFSAREAADAVDDGFGSHAREPDRVFNEGTNARRRLHRATLGQTRAFSEGRHERLLTLESLVQAPVFVSGGLLRDPATRLALQPDPEGGAVVLHRDRIDDQGRLMLTRLDPGWLTMWSTTLPVADLNNRWQLDGRLLLVGTAPAPEGSAARLHEHLISLDLKDGRWQAFTVQDAPAPAPP
jgi:hypothetical protein